MPPRPETDVYRGQPHSMPVDDVSISDHARAFVATRPVDIPPPDDGGDGGNLLEAAREVHGFLADNSRIANSPFGKAAGMLVRGAVHLARNDGAGDLPAESQAKIMQAVGRAREFLENHSRVAESAFGQAVARLGGEFASHVRSLNSDSGTDVTDKVVRAATITHAYLKEHPRIGEMPLGQAVEKLITGVRNMDGGETIDADVKQLAKRIGHFVNAHPRLALSEFGQMVSQLTRGIMALDAAIPSEVDPIVVGDIRPETGPVVADGGSAGIADRTVQVDVARAA